MKRAKKTAAKRYMGDKPFGELKQSLNQALAHARGEQGKCKESKIATPPSRKPR